MANRPMLVLDSAESSTLALLAWALRRHYPEALRIANANGLGRDDMEAKSIVDDLWRKLDAFGAELDRGPVRRGVLVGTGCD